MAQLPMITIPRGRSAAEKRLGAIAALHQPVPDRILAGYTCGECRSTYWPCPTARLLGEWPLDDDERTP